MLKTNLWSGHSVIKQWTCIRHCTCARASCMLCSRLRPRATDDLAAWSDLQTLVRAFRWLVTEPNCKKIAIAENLKLQAIRWSNFDCFPAAVSNIESNSLFGATRAFAKTQRLKCITCQCHHKETSPSDLQKLEWLQRYAQCIKVQMLFWRFDSDVMRHSMVLTL